MSDAATKSSPLRTRPVSLFSVIGVFIGVALFLFVVRCTYLKHPATAAENLPAEQLPEDQAWRATPEARREALSELRAKQEKQLADYGWVDQQKGVVQLPIDKAMELTLKDIQAKQSSRPGAAPSR